MRHEGEPSVEEILESIKKVIARDNRGTLQTERRRRATVGIDSAEPADAEEADEVLELGDLQSADFDAGNLEADETEAGGLALGDAADMTPPADFSAEDGASARLTTESAARSMRESLAALAMIAVPGAPPQIVRSGETSLEGLTRDLLRPMLAQWLDANLPAMVERMVAVEIARIAGKRG